MAIGVTLQYASSASLEMDLPGLVKGCLYGREQALMLQWYFIYLLII